MSESELLELLHTDPQRGFVILMNEYAGLVYTIVYNKLAKVCSQEDIEECVSDIFYTIYTKKGQIDLEKGTLKALLSVIAKRKAIDMFRAISAKSNKYVSIDEGELLFVLQGDCSAETTCIQKETQKELISHVKKLGKLDSEIIIRKYYIGQSTKEIAAALQLKNNTVDKKVSRGIIKLREMLGGC